MSDFWVISKYEYKIQIRRVSGCVVLLFVISSAMIDCLPTTGNVARVEFLQDIHYYVRRIFSFDGLILLFGIMFLTANRLVSDQKNGCRDLFMAAPIGKNNYIGGKFMGNFLYALTLMYTLLLISLIGFAIFSQYGATFSDYTSAILDVSLCIIFPASFFVVASSVMLPELIDIRLFYLLYSILFLTNAFSSDAAAARPFYIFTQGDLAKLVWQHPKSPEIHVANAILNLLFMVGTGILAIALVNAKRRFWRAN